MKRVAAILLIGAFAFATGCRRDRSVSASSASPSASPAAAEPTATPGDPNFPGWPPTWIETYKRFQAYIAARQTSWPESGLQYGLNGDFLHCAIGANNNGAPYSLHLSPRSPHPWEVIEGELNRKSDR